MNRKRPVTRDYVHVAFPIAQGAIESARTLSDADILTYRRALQGMRSMPLPAVAGHADALLKIVDRLEAIKHGGAAEARDGAERGPG
jgi:hypothetical protein